MFRVAIIGIGRVGGALARSLEETNFPVSGLYARAEIEETSRIDAEAIIVSVPDSEIPKVADALRSRLLDEATVLHTSGALTSDVLSALRTGARSVGSMHPLVSLNGDTSRSHPFAGAFFGLEGDEAAIEKARRMVEALDARSILVPRENKALYHAAAVAACGHVAALFDMAVEMMTKAGVENAERALLPLVESTLANITADGTTKALTGTFARADAAGFSRQIAAFDGQLEADERTIYFDLGLRSLELALKNGASPEAVEKMRELIAMAKAELR